uniref:DUF6088 family protein n=1 Tax=Flavobacterium sp. TaxID=239 RepID=UPI00404B4C40
MTLAAQIRERIKKQAEGKTFGYADLGIAKDDYQNAAKVLQRMQKKGDIKKISKGVFYKPEQTVFGELQPDYSEQLRPYLFENGKRIAYETGASLYNQLGLTTQMAFRIKIASQNKRISINRGALKARAVKSYTAVTDDNYELLGLLDALKDIKRIPDCTVANAVLIVSGKFKKFEVPKIKKLISYAMFYPPRVRAILGAILENINTKIDTGELKESINPLTTFQLGLKEKDLPTIKNWNIA